MVTLPRSAARVSGACPEVLRHSLPINSGAGTFRATGFDRLARAGEENGVNAAIPLNSAAVHPKDDLDLIGAPSFSEDAWPESFTSLPAAANKSYQGPPRLRPGRV